MKKKQHKSLLSVDVKAADDIESTSPGLGESPHDATGSPAKFATQEEFPVFSPPLHVESFDSTSSTPPQHSCRFPPAGTASRCPPSWTCTSVPNWGRGRWLPVTWLSGLKRSSKMSSRLKKRECKCYRIYQESILPFWSSSPQCLFWLFSRKYLWCQTWTISTFLWCTARRTVLIHRSVCPVSPSAPRAPPPSPSRGSHQRSPAQTLTSASPLSAEEQRTCTRGTRRTSKDFVPVNVVRERDLELASDGWTPVWLR